MDSKQEKIQQSKLEEVWRKWEKTGENTGFFQTNGKGNIIREELCEGKRLRLNHRGMIECELVKIEHEKQKIFDTLKSVFASPLIKEYFFDEQDYSNGNIHTYDVECSMPDSRVIKGFLTIDHYLQPIPDHMLGIQREVTAVVMHEFTCTMIEWFTAGRRFQYIGNVNDFATRIMKRGYLYKKNLNLLPWQVVSKSFGF